MSVQRMRYVASTFEDYQGTPFSLFAYVELPTGMVPPPVLQIHEPFKRTHEFVLDTAEGERKTTLDDVEAL